MASTVTRDTSDHATLERRGRGVRSTVPRDLARCDVSPFYSRVLSREKEIHIPFIKTENEKHTNVTYERERPRLDWADHIPDKWLTSGVHDACWATWTRPQPWLLRYSRVPPSRAAAPYRWL